MKRIGLLVALSLAVAVSTTACGGTVTINETGGKPGSAGGSPASTAGCPSAAGTATRTTKFDAAPPMCIDANKTYTAKVETSAGALTMKLDPKTSPLAVNNFVFLARNHYYDGVSFHRIIPGFVIQGGDAVGSPPGSGGPGYKFTDELPPSKDVYQPGTLAMANSGPNTNGSQFFIVLAAGALDALYSPFGQVTEGFDTTIQTIAKTGTRGGTPSSPTTMKTVTITES